ncbi:MAG: hypothetical protein IT374_07860 [Polyangiaceae bacterium]|nr:hypothetical protein [Polyangiaceae bacterium]
MKRHSCVAAIATGLCGVLVSLVPACRCAPSDVGAGAAGAPATPSSAPAVSVDSAAVRRVNLRPNLRPLVLSPSGIRPPITAPTTR